MATNGKPGRPSKLTPELAEAILIDVEGGLDPQVAAQAAGVVAKTYYNWITRGKAGEAPFASFYTEIARAKAEAEKRLLQRTLSGDGKGEGFGPAKAALEILSRTRPDRYSQQVKVQLRQDIERVLDVVLRVCGQDHFLAIAEALAEDDSAGTPGEAESDAPEIRH